MQVIIREVETTKNYRIVERIEHDYLITLSYSDFFNPMYKIDYNCLTIESYDLKGDYCGSADYGSAIELIKNEMVYSEYLHEYKLISEVR